MNKTLGYFALVLATLTGVFLLWQFRSVVVLFVFALALAAAMRRLAEDAGLRLRLGEAAIARSKDFTPDRVAEQIRRVYRQVIEKR